MTTEKDTAFRAGWHGKERDVRHNSRPKRLAYRLGQLVGSAVGLADRVLAFDREKALEEAEGSSHGVNKKVLQIIKAQQQIPPTPSDDNVIHINDWERPGEEGLRWGAVLVGQGTIPEPTNKALIGPLPPLMIDGKEHDVTSVALRCSRHEPEGAVASDMYIKVGPPQKDILTVLDGGPYLSSVTVKVAPDGKTLGYETSLEYPVNTSPDAVGPVPREANVIGFLQGVEAIVQNTAAAYASVGSTQE